MALPKVMTITQSKRSMVGWLSQARVSMHLLVILRLSLSHDEVYRHLPTFWHDCAYNILYSFEQDIKYAANNEHLPRVRILYIA